MFGGLGEKTSSRGFNRVTQMKRPTGSAIKPVGVLLPAINEGLITSATMFNDAPETFLNYNGDVWNPTDNDDNYRGNITVRQALESSQNIPFVKIMQKLTAESSMKYLRNMGITSLTDKDMNLSLALGALEIGISPLELAGSYNTIANDGIYIEPTFYSKITSNDGKTVLLKSKQTKTRIISKDVAFILKELLTEPVNGELGTAKYCKMDGIDVAAKTGTTNESYDRWLCGFTPYYTSSCWYGFDMNETVEYTTSKTNPAGLIWARVMKDIHSGLQPAKFKMPNGVTTLSVCRDTGLKATENCTNTYTEYFVKETSLETCTKHR